MGKLFIAVGLCFGSLVNGVFSPPGRVIVTYENATVPTTTSLLESSVIQTFDSIYLTELRDLGVSFDHNNQEYRVSYSGGGKTVPNDKFGGVNQTRYFKVLGYEKLTMTLNKPIDYFGLWIAAMDAGAEVEIFHGSEKKLTLNLQSVMTALNGNTAYIGNPWQNPSSYEPYVFVNFFCDECVFDRITLAQIDNGHFECDNHTFGIFKSRSGTEVEIPSTTTTEAPATEPTTEAPTQGPPTEELPTEELPTEEPSEESPITTESPAVEQPSPSKGEGVSTGVVIGAAAGGLVVVGGAAAGLVWALTKPAASVGIGATEFAAHAGNPPDGDLEQVTDARDLSWV